MAPPDQSQEPDPAAAWATADPLGFLAGSGGMAERIRTHDWSSTPIGPPAGWPQSLRTMVRLMLNTHHPIFVFWGPTHTCLFNDAYGPFMGPERFPAALGKPGREVWAETWDIIRPQIDLVMSGCGATWHRNQLLPFTRGGRLEEAYWTYGFSPIDDEEMENGIGGVLVLTTETTAEVLAERREAARAAAGIAERDRLARMFEQAPGFMCLLDGPEHRIVLANKAYIRVVGERDVLGKTVAEALPEAVGQGFVELLDRVYATGEAFASSGAKYSAPIGPHGELQDRFLDFVYQPITDDAGRVTGIFCQGSDITDRTAGERELARTAGLLRSIIETAPGLIYAKDPQGRMIIANDATLDVIRKPWPEVVGRTETEFLSDAAQAEIIMANDRAVLASGRTQEIEEIVSRLGSRPSYYISKKTPMRDENGTIVGLVGVSIDITARKDAEAELKRLNADLETMVAQRTAERDRTWRYSQDLLCVVDSAGYLRAANPAWKVTLGWEPEEVVGRHHLDFNHSDNHHVADAALVTATAGRLPNVQTRMLHKDGSSRWVAWVASSEDGLVYASGRDVTAERAASDALAQANERLRQSQKMEAVGQLTGGIAHDFNNMLQGVRSASQLMSKRLASGRIDGLDEYLALMDQSVNRAASLTNRLLAFSRRQALAPKSIDLDALITGVVALLRQTVGPEVVVETRLTDGCWPVCCDPNQMESALLNLAINARDAMLPDGGTLRLTTEHVVIAEGDLLDWDGARPGDFVRITVADTGTGMTADVLEHAFEPFYTTKPAGHGTGLGLSQVFGFVSQSSGVVRLESEPGRGTSVHLYLPRHVEREPLEKQDFTPLSTTRTLAAATVLLVEDEVAIRRLAREALHDLGCTVLEAEDGGSGLAIIRAAARAGGSRVDLLVADIGLPGGINGRQLADAAREVLPKLPIILITGYAGQALNGAHGLAPGVELLRKPFSLEALTTRAQEALAPTHSNMTD